MGILSSVSFTSADRLESPQNLVRCWGLRPSQTIAETGLGCTGKSGAWVDPQIGLGAVPKRLGFQGAVKYLLCRLSGVRGFARTFEGAAPRFSQGGFVGGTFVGRLRAAV